jgi:HSP20 family protein
MKEELEQAGAWIGDVYLRQLHGRLGDVVYQLMKVQFTQFSPPRTWSPALNIYRCDECLVVCADLAGVKREGVEVGIESRRLVIRGERAAPEPSGDGHRPVQVLAMEIDYGFFAREVLLPADVEPREATVAQENGLLWIHLPLRAHA